MVYALSTRLKERRLGGRGDFKGGGGGEEEGGRNIFDTITGRWLLI